MGKSCVFFGHRKAALSKQEKELLHNLIIALISRCGVDTFIFGRYGDFDALAYQIVCDIKRTLYPHILRHLALAYLPKKDDADYFSRIYDAVFCPEGIENGPPRFAILRRNRLLAEQSDYMVCYVESPSGGAYKAMTAAQNYGRRVINLYNFSLSTSQNCDISALIETNLD